MIKYIKTYLKEITENKDNIVYYINKIKRTINNEKIFKINLKKYEKRDGWRSKITYGIINKF